LSSKFQVPSFKSGVLPTNSRVQALTSKFQGVMSHNFVRR
jgi:hypothetical protein